MTETYYLSGYHTSYVIELFGLQVGRYTPGTPLNAHINGKNLEIVIVKDRHFQTTKHSSVHKMIRVFRNMFL